MGIKDLCTFLKKRSPELFTTVPLSCFSGSYIAVDISVYFYKFISMDNQLKGNWIDMFINFILWLRKYNIRPIFVFDGTAPIEKEPTRIKRREIRSRYEKEVIALEELYTEADDYEEEVFKTPFVKDSVPIEGGFTGDFQQKVIDRLKRTVADDLFSNKRKMLTEIHEGIKKGSGRVIKIGPEETQKMQDLLTFLGLPWFKATGEAEKTCAWLCKFGYVKGVLTTDSDTLVYGTPVFIRNVKTGIDTCEIILYDQLLQVLGFTEAQFVDFCILCGTDYNNRLPGIGPVKIYELIESFGSLEEISQNGFNVETIKYPIVRQLFTLPLNVSNVIQEWPNDQPFKIPFIKEMTKGALIMFLFENNSRFTVDLLENPSFVPTFKIKEAL